MIIFFGSGESLTPSAPPSTTSDSAMQVSNDPQPATERPSDTEIPFETLLDNRAAFLAGSTSETDTGRLPAADSTESVPDANAEKDSTEAGAPTGAASDAKDEQQQPGDSTAVGEESKSEETAPKTGEGDNTSQQEAPTAPTTANLETPGKF